MVIAQYPHFCYKLKQNETTRDENGNWTDASSEEWEFACNGRYELGVQGSIQKNEDSNRIEYSGTFYTKTSGLLGRNDKIIISSKKLAQIVNSEKITKSNCVLANGYVVSVDETQLHTKIYFNDNN